jgi:hypothetical protein
MYKVINFLKKKNYIFIPVIFFLFFNILYFCQKTVFFVEVRSITNKSKDYQYLLYIDKVSQFIEENYNSTSLGKISNLIDENYQNINIHIKNKNLFNLGKIFLFNKQNLDEIIQNYFKNLNIKNEDIYFSIKDLSKLRIKEIADQGNLLISFDLKNQSHDIDNKIKLEILIKLIEESNRFTLRELKSKKNNYYNTLDEIGEIYQRIDKFEEFLNEDSLKDTSEKFLEELLNFNSVLEQDDWGKNNFDYLNYKFIKKNVIMEARIKASSQSNAQWIENYKQKFSFDLNSKLNFYKKIINNLNIEYKKLLNKSSEYEKLIERINKEIDIKFSNLLNDQNEEIKKIKNQIITDKKKYLISSIDWFDNIKNLNLKNYEGLKELEELIDESKMSNDYINFVGILDNSKKKLSNNTYIDRFMSIKKKGLGSKFTSDVRLLNEINDKINEDYNNIFQHILIPLHELMNLDDNLAAKNLYLAKKMNTPLTKKLDAELDFDYSYFISNYFENNHPYVQDKKINFIKNIKFFKSLINKEIEPELFRKIDLNSINFRKKFVNSYYFTFIASLLFSIFIGGFLFLLKKKLRKI